MLPVHKATGKPAPNAMTQHKIEPLMRHLQYLTNLGEVRATRVVSTVVKGMEERTNPDVDDDAIYLPRYMTIRSCYKRYMNMLGCNAWTTGSVVTIIECADGNDIRPLYYLSATKFAKSPTPTDSEEIAYVAALRVVILALRHLCLPKKLQATSESNTAN